MKKMTFIYPAIGKKQGSKYIRTWKMEPLPISTLAGLTPDNIEMEFFDDRIELIDYETDTDLVAISVETYTAKRAYYIADKFRNRGTPVVLGGYHPTHMPDEGLQHADAVVIGNAEQIWLELLNDVKNISLKNKYNGQPGHYHIFPDRSIYQDKNYLKLGLVETGRGCHFTCNFCHITSYYNGKYYSRSIEAIVEEIKQSGHKYFFFVDDNFVSNKQFTLELCKAITPLNIYWAGQGTLTIANDPELLKWLRKSGCVALLIGFESLEQDNLKQMNKSWNARLGNLKELVRKIHDTGIGIYATFLFGYDFDTAETFQKTLEFALESEFLYAAFNHLLPLPATPLYKYFQEENRLLKTEWWLTDGYKYGDVVFQPKKMSPEELSQRCVDARNTFFSFSSIFRRGYAQLKRNISPVFLCIFLSSNFHLKEEVGSKLALPIGEGLDELPK